MVWAGLTTSNLFQHSVLQARLSAVSMLNSQPFSHAEPSSFVVAGCVWLNQTPEALCVTAARWQPEAEAFP